MKLVMMTMISVLIGAAAHAEPFLGCHMGIQENGQTKVTWVEAEMVPGSSVPIAAGNRNAVAKGQAEGIVPFRLADGRSIEIYTRWNVEFTKAFDSVAVPMFAYELDFKVREVGQVFKTLHSDKNLMSHYIPGFMVLDADLSLKRIEISNGIATEAERAKHLVVSFFCDPVTIQHLN